MPDANHCASCGRAVDGAVQRHCPGCGHPVLAPRIDWRFLAWQLEHGVLNMDRGLLYTLRMLMFRPGRLIRDYIEGRRTGHVKPLWLIMATAALVVFVTRYVPGAEGAIASFGAGYQAGMEAEGDVDADSIAMVEAFQQVGDWAVRHFAAVTLILLPLEAAVFKLAFWRVKGLNYPEWLTIIAFLTAQFFVIWSFFFLLGWWMPGAGDWALWVGVGYSVFSLVQAFDDYPRWKTALRGIVGFGMYFIASTVVVVAVSLAAAATATGGQAAG